VTSDNYRNPKNSPDGFESSAIHAFKIDLIKPAGERNAFFETFQGSTYRYSVPVIVNRPCLRCHGTPQDAPREVIEKYGAGRGFGYREGDIRGIITVDLPVISLLSLSPVTNILSLGLIAAAFAINFYLFKRLILDRITRLTAMTGKMVHGELDTDLAPHYRQDSSDELDNLYNAMDLMRKSVKIVMERLKRH
jgi:hypothetical protein